MFNYYTLGVGNIPEPITLEQMMLGGGEPSLGVDFTTVRKGEVVSTVFLRFHFKPRW
jgi:hypothetical protein